MIITHEISRSLINSFCSLEMIQAFDRVIGVRSQIQVRVFHTWDTLTNIRTIKIKHRTGQTFYLQTLLEDVYPDSLKGPASIQPAVIAARDIVSWLKTKAVEDLQDLLLKVKNDNREIPHDVVEQLVTSIGRDVASI